MDKSPNGKGRKIRATLSSLLPVCLLKLFFHSVNALGVEKSARHSCSLQSNSTKADSKKDKVRDGNPFSIHYAQPVDRGGA